MILFDLLLLLAHRLPWRRLAFLLAAAIVLPIHGGTDQPAPQPQAVQAHVPKPLAAPVKPAAKRQSIPSDAVFAAQADAVAVANVLRQPLPFYRWVWVRSGVAEDFKAVLFTLNLISRNRDVFNPAASGILVRVDLHDLSSNERDLAELIELWESFQFDPAFSLLITGDTLRLLSAEHRAGIVITKRVTEWGEQRADGSWPVLGRSFKAVPLGDVKNIVVERVNPEHLRGTGLEMLQDATGSLAPVVSDTYFIRRVLSAIKDRTKVVKNGKEVFRENLYSTLYGGLYQEFVGIRKSQVKGRSDFDQFLIDRGVVLPGKKFQEVFDQLPAAQRVAMEQSRVTGKPRRIVWLPTLASRPTESESICWATVDVEDADVDASGHALLNLGDGLIARAFEVIATNANGHLLYALFNGAGELLEQAVQEIVTDSTVPLPHTARLDGGAISCVRCHGPQGAWQPIRNDLLTASNKIDVFGSRLVRDQFDQVQKLRSQYRGDFTSLLARLGRFQARTVLLSTGPWKESKDQSDVVQLASARVAASFALDRYGLVTPEIALAELGEPPIALGDSAKDEAAIRAAGFLRRKAPRIEQKPAPFDQWRWAFEDETDEFSTLEALRIARLDKLLAAPKPRFPGEFVFHDVRLALLQTGVPILRNDWSLIYAFARQRADAARAALRPAK